MARFTKGTLDHDGRMGGSRKGDKAMSKSKDKDPELQAAYEQGRKARANSISREQPPVLSDTLKDEWLAGWDFEDDQRT